MHELKFPLCTNSPCGVTPPLWARRCLLSIKSTKPPESPHRGVTPLFVPTATEELSLAPAAPQGLSPPSLEQPPNRDTQSQDCRPSTSVFFRLAVLAAPVTLSLPMQDVIIPQGVKLCYRLAATFLCSLLRDEFLCSEPALQELSFAPQQFLLP